jgi:hypothetical protein
VSAASLLIPGTASSAPCRDYSFKDLYQSVQRPRGCGVGKLADGRHDPTLGRRSGIIPSESKLVSSGSALLKRMFTVALEHQPRRAPNINLGYHTVKPARSLSTKA